MGKCFPGSGRLASALLSRVKKDIPVQARLQYELYLCIPNVVLMQIMGFQSHICYSVYFVVFNAAHPETLTIKLVIGSCPY